MRPCSTLPMMAALALGLTACQPGAAPLSDADLAAIQGVPDRYAQLSLAQDFAGAARLFTEDAVRMPPNQEVHQGRDAILAFLEQFPPVTEFEAAAVEVTGSGDLAVGRGTFSFTAPVEGASEPMQERGKWMAIWQKQADGSWLMSHDIWNSDMPLP